MIREVLARQAAQEPPPRPPTADIAKAIVETYVSPAVQMQRVNERIGIIMRRVNHPDFMRVVASELAWACEQHGLRWDGSDNSVVAALDDLDRKDWRKEITSTRSRFFNGCAKRLLARCGAPPRKSKPK